MIETLDDLKKVIDLCRKNGVKSVKDGQFSFELVPEALFPESEYKKKKRAKEPDLVPDAVETLLREEATLFWSAQGVAEESRMQ